MVVVLPLLMDDNLQNLNFITFHCVTVYQKSYVETGLRTKQVKKLPWFWRKGSADYNTEYKYNTIQKYKWFIHLPATLWHTTVPMGIQKSVRSVLALGTGCRSLSLFASVATTMNHIFSYQGWLKGKQPPGCERSPAADWLRTSLRAVVPLGTKPGQRLEKGPVTDTDASAQEV